MFQPIGKLVTDKFQRKMQTQSLNNAPNGQKNNLQKLGLARLGLARSLEAAAILSKINQQSVGRYLAATYRAQRLTVIAPSAGAAQNLVLRREAVILEINKLFSEPIVKDLIVHS